MPSLEGLIAATFTPMNSDGSLALARVAPMVDRLISDGVAGLYVCGSTGEGPSLSTQERMEVAASFVDASRGRVPVVVQVGHNALTEAATLAAHAERIGAQAISATPPSYFPLTTIDDLVASLQIIAAAAPSLPFYYYHIPVRTGVEVDIVELLKQADDVPTLRGIKFTSSRVDEFQAALHAGDGRFELLFGSDEMLLSALAVGARGAVGSTYNFAAPLYRKMIAAVKGGDLLEARRLQARSVELVRVIHRWGGLAPQKSMMDFIGCDCGPTRRPLSSLTPPQIEQLRTELRELGFFASAGNGSIVE